ncbi:MAG: hypothetical protein ABI446_08390 [Gemmatimonadaceae bacterium]
MSQIDMHARSLGDDLRENHVHLLVISCLVATNAFSGIDAVPGIRQDTTTRALVDSSSTHRIATPATALPALGTVESAVAMSYSMTERMMTPLEARADDFSAFALPDNSLLATSNVSDTTSRSQRPRAIEYSDAYHVRLKIHQIGAYAMLPLFITEYFVGQKLLNSTTRPQSLRSAHSLLAGGVGIVFAVNTVTGAWNFWDARKDPKGRTRREIHSALMLASDVGVLLTAISGSNAKHSLASARTHRTIAISSIALSAVGTGMMWLWRDK